MDTPLTPRDRRYLVALAAVALIIAYAAAGLGLGIAPMILVSAACIVPVASTLLFATGVALCGAICLHGTVARNQG